MLKRPLLRGLLLLGILATLVLLPASVGAIKDPSAAYCQELGYQFVIETTAEGETGYCLLPGNQRVDAWDFLVGTTGTEFSYCEQEGYVLKTVENRTTCLRYLSDRCAVCVLANGTEVEVTALMGLDLRETTCGDKICGVPENTLTCPGDCPSGSADGYCDGQADRTCDPDCGVGRDPDCVAAGETTQPSTTRAPLEPVLVIAGLIAVLTVLRRHN
jgi:putative hemolysin